MTDLRGAPEADRSRLRAALLIVAIGVALFVLLLVLLDGGGPLVPIDSEPRLAARDLAPTGVADVAAFVTVFGSLPVVAAAVLAGVVALALARRPGDALALALGFVVMVLAVGLVKSGVGRLRPPGASASLTTASFPSGHAAYATAYTALAVALVGARDTTRARRFAAIGCAIALTVLIGSTRVVLDVHYLSDVVAGWALSAAVFALAAAMAIVVARMRNTGRHTRASSEGSHAPP